MTILLSFLIMSALDLAWVGYNRSTAQGRKALGVLWAMGLAALSGLNAIAIVDDPWNLIGTVLGAAAGTLGGMYLAPWLEERKAKEWARRKLMSASEAAEFFGADFGMPLVAPPDPRKLAIEAALVDIGAELQRARLKFAPFHSAHEGFAVALEEVDELRAHVWAKQSKRDLDAMRTEAIQAAAMFAAFAAECCGEESGRV